MPLHKAQMLVYVDRSLISPPTSDSDIWSFNSSTKLGHLDISESCQNYIRHVGLVNLLRVNSLYIGQGSGDPDEYVPRGCCSEISWVVTCEILQQLFLPNFLCRGEGLWTIQEWRPRRNLHQGDTEKQDTIWYLCISMLLCKNVVHLSIHVITHTF